MTKNLFSVPIFFIAFRETLEAAIIVSVLLGLAEQIVYEDPGRFTQERTVTSTTDESKTDSPEEDLVVAADEEVQRRRLIRKLRIQIFAGAGIGLFIALAVGAAFIAVWFTQASNLWANTEELWEGIFDIIASLMIFVMGVSMLKMDRAKAKWRLKLQKAFDGRTKGDNDGKAGKWVLLILPLITVLREGLEAVIFIGGVSLGQPATAIPIAAIVGLVCGLIVGFLIYQFGSRTTLSIFLIAMTNLLLLIGAGLFSRGVWAFQENAFNNLLGADVDDAGGDGPGSFQVQGNIWHLDCCNPEDNLDNSGWSIFNAIFGWTNSATLGSVLSYVFYWIAVIVTLIIMKYKEGRTTLFGRESTAGRARRIRREKAASQSRPADASSGSSTDEK
ncbi:iron permease FTR1 [Lentinula raphanica]|uniref:Iron permease FTR1 n=1 Tax=Lentinula raphanica TaxID=153919 RepID=A0AA38UDY2_9AGAR|nr:Ftr1 protein [Lentinula raphanica]KAJ3760755.1 iron permease FTR1 [Lentinula raphanica]KAJ3765140.1 iron permease FTR1 [Lentinula raphanica]KAJ3818852.1 iron permease FTR1 [Lentinula raphanica]KAJ3838184.1 iron permease FTR1 [Lentinula raphanica]